MLTRGQPERDEIFASIYRFEDEISSPGPAFLKNSGDCYKRHAARIDMYGVCYECGDLHANLSRHSIGCDRRPSDTIPPHSDELNGEPSARNPNTPSTPAAETFNQGEQSSRSILLPWGIEDVGPMLDALDGTTLAWMSFSTIKVVRQENRMPFARSLRHTLRIFCQAHNAPQVAPAGDPHNEPLVTNLERATKLLHITPALLQSSDGQCSRQGRYNEYIRGELTGLLGWLVVFAGRSRQKAREDTPEARRMRTSKLAHQRGGINKAASALISPPAALRDSRTLATLRGKHPTEDPVAIATGKAQAEGRAGNTAVGEQEQQPNVTSEPFDAQEQIPEVKNLFEEASVKAVIKKANPQNAADPSGLRYSHLQAALCDELAEDLAAFATLLFSSRVLPQVSWTLHTSANLSALGQKARPVACGDVLRRVIGAVFCRRYGRKLADYFQPWGQYGVAVSGGVEIMAFTATLGFEEGCTILSYDGANAYNSIYRHRFLPALAEIVPSVVPYPSNVYARDPPKLLFALDGRGLEVVESARGVQQGCNLGPLCYSAGSLKILKESRANLPVPGARVVSFIDDITVILPPELSLNMMRQGKLRNGCRNAWG